MKEILKKRKREGERKKHRQKREKRSTYCHFFVHGSMFFTSSKREIMKICARKYREFQGTNCQHLHKTFKTSEFNLHVSFDLFFSLKELTIYLFFDVWCLPPLPNVHRKDLEKICFRDLSQKLV